MPMPPQKINPKSHERSPCSTFKVGADGPNERGDAADAQRERPPAFDIFRCLEIIGIHHPILHLRVSRRPA